MSKDALEMALELTIDGTDFKVPGANIKNLEIELCPYGYKSQLSFWVSSESGQDKLFDPFITSSLVDCCLQISPHFKPEDAEIEPLKLQGIVTRKAILEERTIENVHLSGDPVLYRYYRIDFADPAQVLWQQHFPCDLLVDGSVKDLIEGNKATAIDLLYDWDRLDDKYAIHTLTPGTRDSRTSFYDFIAWYATTYNGDFNYDCNNNQYTLSGSKNHEGQAVAISELEIGDYRIEFPATIRYNDRLLNVCSEEPEIKQTSREQAKDELRCDTLRRQPIAAEFDKDFDLESCKQKIREPEINLNHARFPQLTYRPGVYLKLEGGLWSDKIFVHGKEYCVVDICLQAQAADAEPDADHNLSYSTYQFDMQSRLEPRGEEARNLPPFKTPGYPLMVEGRIISEQGSEEDDTYQFYEHPQGGFDHYRVAMPIFDEQQVVAPFEPLFAPGHFYFPAYKGERVLVALDFQHARITGFLDWRPDCRLPMDSQGNHLLLGKNAESQTSISHSYSDSKPQLLMKRTSANDCQVLQLLEGSIVLEAKEEKT